MTTNSNHTRLHEASFNLPECCSVYLGELAAIKETCNYVHSENNEHIIVGLIAYRLQTASQQSVVSLPITRLRCDGDSCSLRTVGKRNRLC